MRWLALSERKQEWLLMAATVPGGASVLLQYHPRQISLRMEQHDSSTNAAAKLDRSIVCEASAIFDAVEMA
jgi:hypothetical protein